MSLEIEEVHKQILAQRKKLVRMALDNTNLPADVKHILSVIFANTACNLEKIQYYGQKYQLDTNKIMNLTFGAQTEMTNDAPEATQ